MSDTERANNFVESVYGGYHLANLKAELVKFRYNTSTNHPFTEEMVEQIIKGFERKGMIANIITKGADKKYPSTSLTLEFSK